MTQVANRRVISGAPSNWDQDPGQNRLKVNWLELVAQFGLDVRYYKETLDPASVAANTAAEQTFTVTGVNTNDLILTINKPTATAGVGIVGWRIAAANTVGITFMNATGGSVNPASESYEILTVRIK